MLKTGDKIVFCDDDIVYTVSRIGSCKQDHCIFPNICRNQFRVTLTSGRYSWEICLHRIEEVIVL